MSHTMISPTTSARCDIEHLCPRPKAADVACTSTKESKNQDFQPPPKLDPIQSTEVSEHTEIYNTCQHDLPSCFFPTCSDHSNAQAKAKEEQVEVVETPAIVLRFVMAAVSWGTREQRRVLVDEDDHGGGVPAEKNTVLEKGGEGRPPRAEGATSCCWDADTGRDKENEGQMKGVLSAVSHHMEISPSSALGSALGYHEHATEHKRIVYDEDGDDDGDEGRERERRAGGDETDVEVADGQPRRYHPTSHINEYGKDIPQFHGGSGVLGSKNDIDIVRSEQFQRRVHSEEEIWSWLEELEDV
ncbi:hypothetical protein B0H17DRAFT_1125769 [Mycena rosella]|uniref:Uncharacterized protein n=1 Tax=Mycena rosella TaxID=1033263 RepID=A0AAD7GWZ1_MYCRO|nr:hypothetical protein B0H17DRAFT_1125769 [Mycena rosella]